MKVEKWKVVRRYDAWRFLSWELGEWCPSSPDTVDGGWTRNAFSVRILSGTMHVI